MNRRSFIASALAFASAATLGMSWRHRRRRREPPTPPPAPPIAAPRGLVGMGLQDNVASQPFLTGVYGTLRWEDAEPVEGQYNWNKLMDVVDTAAQWGKKATVVLAAGPWTPQWVFDAGAQGPFFDFDKNFGRDSGIQQIPHGWDPVFLEKWRATVAAFGAEFDSLPEVALVHMGGPGKNGMEMHLPPEGTLIDTTWANEGYSDDLYAESYRVILDAYKAAFPTTALDVDIHNVNGSPVPAQMTAEYGTNTMGDQFGTFGGWLSGIPGPRNGELIDLATAQAAETYHDWQLIGNETGQPERLLNGSVVDAIEWGRARGAHYFELWGIDVRNESLWPEFERIAAELA